MDTCRSHSSLPVEKISTSVRSDISLYRVATVSKPTVYISCYFHEAFLMQILLIIISIVLVKGCLLQMVVACLCILAVDFRIFPRKHAKTETYGVSLVRALKPCVVCFFFISCYHL